MAETGIAVRNGTSAGALAQLSVEKRELLKRTIAKGATDDELELALTISATLGLDPFAKQIAFIKRWDSKEQRQVMSIQPTIDGARLLAQRSAKYGGQIGPFWCGPDGQWVEVWLSNEPPAAAKVGVIHHDWKEPLYAVAKFASYCQRNKEGRPMALWATMPDLMIAKCAEMLALRRAFPAEFHHAYGGSEESAAADAVNWGNVVDVEGTVSDAQLAQVVAIDETQSRPTRADINRALHAAAERRGVTHEQLTAMAVQFFGAAESLTEVSDENLARLANRIEKADDEALAATLALLNTPEDDDAADAEPVETAGDVSADAVDELESSATESDDIRGQIEQEFLDAIGRAWTPETLQEIAGRLRESGISTQALRDAYKVRSQYIAITQQRQAKSQPELVSVAAPERPIDERIPL